MKRSRVFRLLKRSVFILPVIWMFYVINEVAFSSNTRKDEFYNLPPNIDVNNFNNKRAEILATKTYDNMLHVGNKDSPLKSDSKLNDAKIHAHNQTDLRTTVKDISLKLDDYHSDKLQQSKKNEQQLEELAEMGGKLVEKKPKEFFDHVVLPLFNHKIDPRGPGEMGNGLHTDIKQMSKEQRTLYQKGWSSNNFNQYASDLISIHRSLPDGRSMACKNQANSYSNQLPEISVIIIFHNEAWSVLLRSVHSILSRTEEKYLREIILVDDFSTKEYLKDPLEKYFTTYQKVKIVRATKRQGLTRARLLGFYVSSSPILVFLDSHIECFPGWAEPLLSRIQEDPTRVVFPSIEVINDEHLQTSCNSNVNQFGVFSFKDLTFQWQMISQSEIDRRKTDADPIRSPTMPGGLFAISREFFERIGTYDPGLDYWGGENIELSFKAWMCGGSVELVTCSHIGHIFRRNNPIMWTHNIGNKNSIRVAEVWMDDYKNYFFERILYNLGDYGNVADRKTLRGLLKCHSFEWYLREIYPGAIMPVRMKYAGEIRSVASPRCVDSMGSPDQNQQEPKLYQCHGQGYNQFWYLSEGGQIHQDHWHICVSGGTLVSKTRCETPGPTWKYTEARTLLHIPTNLCMTASVSSDGLSVSACSDIIYQKWELQPRRSDLKFPE